MTFPPMLRGKVLAPLKLRFAFTLKSTSSSGALAPCGPARPYNAYTSFPEATAAKNHIQQAGR